MKRLFNVLAIAGFVIIVGAVGTQDYMVEVGVYYPTAKMIKPIVTGMIMMLPTIGRILWREIH